MALPSFGSASVVESGESHGALQGLVILLIFLDVLSSPFLNGLLNSLLDRGVVIGIGALIVLTMLGGFSSLSGLLLQLEDDYEGLADFFVDDLIEKLQNRLDGVFDLLI